MKIDQLTHAPMFAGINGFGIAADLMGWSQPFHCEIDSFCQTIIQYYWPNSKPYYDIRETDFTIHRGQIDILTGGFPCQPYSTAGKRLGTEDDRHLWPEMLRAIREIQPRFVVGENVAGLLSWNEEVVFEEVQTDLEVEGYEVQPVLLPACAINAPHRRDRIWFVAFNTNFGTEREGGNLERQNNGRFQESKQKGVFQQKNDIDTGQREVYESFTNTHSGVIQEPKRECTNVGQTSEGRKTRGSNYDTTQQWDKWPTQSPICNGDDGLSSRLDGITFPKWRNESIKAGGNAIVPQVAYQIFKAIAEVEEKQTELFS